MPMRLGRLQRESRRGCRAPRHRSSMPPICAPRILRRHSGPMPCRLSAARIINFSLVMSTSERSTSERSGSLGWLRVRRRPPTQTPLSGHKNRNAPPKTAIASRLRMTTVIPAIYHDSPATSG
jgi:hypothetical protein